MAPARVVADGGVERAARVARQDADVARAVVRHDHVRPPVAVQVRDRDRVRVVSAGGVGNGSVERARRVARQDADRA